MATPSRQVRVSDELWTEAEEILARRGTTRGAYIVAKLTELVQADRVARAFVDGLEPAGGRDDDYSAAALDADADAADAAAREATAIEAAQQVTR